MIIVNHVYQVISDLLLVFSREKSPSVLRNYTFNLSEYNGKLEGGGRGATSVFTLRTISSQG